MRVFSCSCQPLIAVQISPQCTLKRVLHLAESSCAVVGGQGEEQVAKVTRLWGVKGSWAPFEAVCLALIKTFGQGVNAMEVNQF